jgi:hypothetical protein
MLRIRAEQMLAFEQAAMRRFEDEMVVHSKDFEPLLCEIIGEEQLRVAIRQAIARAAAYGFTYRGPIRLFIEMMFLSGSAFDTDPQYPAFGNLLRSSDDQMQRAERIREEFLDYLEKVSGPDAINVQKALRELLVLARDPVTLSESNFVAEMLQGMTRVFPQKVAYVGEKALTVLIHEGLAEAQRYGFRTVRSKGMIVVLMFAFGHGCTNDPLYPWLSRTLTDTRIVDPAARAQRLEKKSITWLEHVVANNAGSLT